MNKHFLGFLLGCMIITFLFACQGDSSDDRQIPRVSAQSIDIIQKNNNTELNLKEEAKKKNHQMTPVVQLNHYGQVKSIAISPNGLYAATGDTEGFFIWDTQTQLNFGYFPCEGWVTDLVFDYDSKHLLVEKEIDYPNMISYSIIEVPNGKEIFTITNPELIKFDNYPTVLIQSKNGLWSKYDYLRKQYLFKNKNISEKEKSYDLGFIPYINHSEYAISHDFTQVATLITSEKISLDTIFSNSLKERDSLYYILEIWSLKDKKKINQTLFENPTSKDTTYYIGKLEFSKDNEKLFLSINQDLIYFPVNDLNKLTVLDYTSFVLNAQNYFSLLGGTEYSISKDGNSIIVTDFTTIAFFSLPSTQPKYLSQRHNSIGSLGGRNVTDLKLDPTRNSLAVLEKIPNHSSAHFLKFLNLSYPYASFYSPYYYFNPDEIDGLKFIYDIDLNYGFDGSIIFLNYDRSSIGVVPNNGEKVIPYTKGEALFKCGFVKYCATLTKNELQITNATDSPGEVIRKIDNSNIIDFQFSLDDNFIAIRDKNSLRLEVLDILKNKSIIIGDSIMTYQFAKTNNYLYYSFLSKDSINVIEPFANKILNQFPTSNKGEFYINSDQQSIIIKAKDSDTYYVKSLLFHKKPNHIKWKKITLKNVIDIEFSKNGEMMYVHNFGPTIDVYDFLTGEKKLSIYCKAFLPTIMFSPDGYYLSTGYDRKQEGLERSIIGFKHNNKMYTLAQADLKFNRPDKILKHLGYTDSLTLFLLNKTYQKRLKKLNFTEDMLSDDFHVPKIAVETEDIPVATNQPQLSIEVRATDTKQKLDRLNVYINDVPVFGINGINLRPNNTQSWEQELNLILSQGENKIQVSALNQGGAESLKETFYITYDAPKSKPTLYLIGIAADDFNNDELDLTYPTKDIQDWIMTYTTPTDKYQKVVTKTLYNNDISKGNLQTLKATLEQSQVDDQVILFVAGHGLLDDSLNYYLATPTTDFNNPAKGGILYEDLENLLDGIPARQKLFLLDACHSGEIDKEETEIVQREMVQKDSIVFRSFGNVPQPKNLGLANSFELMKQLFVDLRRGTGATVISSASGVEFAREGEEWNNSVFTYCLLLGIKEMKADLDKDGQIMVSELQKYLAQEVPALTKGHQQPTMRVENISNDWRVW